ncbi:MAG: hypothetical protein P9M08_04935 [Candidatus Erginobacter occultus]|nr:hypothetical protein [Candidatus Erginobacter occultus]
MRVVIGDITKFEVDAIVNAANRSLLGGGRSTGPPGPEHRQECLCYAGGGAIPGAAGGPRHQLFRGALPAQLVRPATWIISGLELRN